MLFEYLRKEPDRKERLRKEIRGEKRSQGRKPKWWKGGQGRKPRKGGQGRKPRWWKGVQGWNWDVKKFKERHWDDEKEVNEGNWKLWKGGQERKPR